MELLRPGMEVDSFMHSFKKALLSFLAILLCVIALSAIIIAPYMSEQDRKTRAELAGNLNYLVIGASHAQLGFSPEILDDELGVNSYNLSSLLMPMCGRLEILKKETNRNPVKTVVLEISYDALSIDNDKTYNEGDPQIIARLDTLSERINYLATYVSVDGWLNIYARMVVYGVSQWKDNILNHSSQSIVYKGYTPRSASDVTLSEQDAVTKLDRWSYKVSDTRQENLDMLKLMIEMCKEHHIRVIVVVTPLSDSFIWEHSKMDDFSSMLSEFSKNIGCEFYDLNLDRNRYSIYSDDVSFMDETHLSESGATKMTERFCQIITEAASGKDTNIFFYDSYEEMKQESPYRAFSN